MTLPSFRYHPDPVKTGSIVQSDERCDCCGQQRGFIYELPVYTEHGDPKVCPWCIADGSAHKKFDGDFNDTDAISDDVPQDVADEIAHRTPAFFSWQDGIWLSCCGDAAAFLESIGYAEICERYPDLKDTVLSYLEEDFEIADDAKRRRYLEELSVEHGPTAHVFACPHCGTRKLYIDYT